MRFAKFVAVNIVAGLGSLAAQPALAQDMKPVLTLATAKKMAEGCEQKAKTEGWKMNIAVVDDGGNLKYFSRMDDSFLISIKVAQLKANTSAGVPVSSKKFGEISKSVPGLELVPGTATFAGGLPIMTGGGKHIGAIGVSGATADQDEACAQAGLDAVKDSLK
jgi:glc operon protein GlcG